MTSRETRGADTPPPALVARNLGKQYGRRAALVDCTVTIPSGRVVGLVGPNGAGKSTLLGLACGLLAPTTGTLEVLGAAPTAGPEHLARIGYVAQDAPVYAGLSVEDHLELGRRLNPRWDRALAARRVADVGLDPRQRAGRLSGGQRAQLALTLALAKRPDLLVLDEPAASLDPFARHALLQGLMEYVVEHGASVILSSHLVADLERVCDHLVVLSRSRVRLVGDVDELLATHYRVTGPRHEPAPATPGRQVIWSRDTDRQRTSVVRSLVPLLDDGTVEPLGFEDLVLAYMAPTDPAPPEDR